MWNPALRKGFAGSLFATLAAFPQAVSAADYPSRPVTLLVGYAAGGVTDLSARVLADKLKPLLGQSVVVENRVGAGGHLSFSAVAEAPPDGLLLAVANPATVALKVLSKAYTLDPIKDFTYVAKYVTSAFPTVLVVPANAPYKTLGELVAYARANPGSLNFASPGGQPDLDVASLAHAGGFKVTIVRYKGSTPIQQAIAAGEVGAVMEAIVSAKPNLDSGRSRLLAVTGQKREPNFPDTPAVGEVVPGFSIPPFWFGIIGPAKLPREIEGRLNAAIKSAMSEADVASRLTPMGLKAEVGSPEDLRSLAVSELDRLTRAAKLIGMEPQ